MLIQRAALVWALAALSGCGAASPPPPAPPEPPPVETAKVAEPPPVEPAALPFHMPCASDDVVGCTNACNDGFAEDCVTVGVMYLSGAVVSVDRERAVELFHRACLRDSARGCMLLADAYHTGMVTVPLGGTSPRDPHVEEVVLYRRACDSGANQGCVLAGRALAAGHGATRDAEQAARLFAKVCDRGNADACLELGKLYTQGDGVKRDPERAAGLFRKACGLGLQEGCLRASPKGDERSPRM